MTNFTSHSAKDTMDFGEKIASLLKKGDIVILSR